MPALGRIPTVVNENVCMFPVVSSDSMARLWNVKTGEVKREYSGHQKAVVALAFKEDTAD